MNKRLIEVIQGNTSRIIKAAPKVDGARPQLDENWVCRTALLDEEGIAIFTRGVTNKTQDNQRFLVALTPTETALCAPGTYTWVIEISNSTTEPPFNVERDYPLRVKPQKLI